MANKPELLAPCGNFDCLKAAVNAGADAVYLAGERYGARAYAGNFSNDELLKAIKYAHIFGVKVYLTVNTLIKESEINEICDFIKPLYEAKLDGVILQDLGVVKKIRDNFPNLNLSASTQMTVTDAKAANLLYKYGLNRVIPARELSLADIYSLTENTKAQVEVFIHGAMCYSYSGQCLFSSILGERSANRGRCAAPCRFEYSYKDSKKEYMLSLKDMMALEYLPKLIEAGVSSFKIEGRMKPPEYVAAVVSVYRKYIDLYFSSKSNFKIDESDKKILESVYIRGCPGCGYLDGKKGREMISTDSPAYVESDERILDFVREKYINTNKKRNVYMDIVIKANENAKVILYDDTVGVTVWGFVPQAADKSPIDKDTVKDAFLKLGNTMFSAESINIELDKGLFVPRSKLNDLRRQGVEALEKEILLQY